MNNSLSDTLEIVDSTIVKRLEKLSTELIGQASHQKYASITLPVIGIDPLAYLEKSWNRNCFQYYWEKPSDELAIAAGEEMLSVSASGKNRFSEINKRIKALQKITAEYSFASHPCSGLMFLGGFSFFDTISSDVWKSFKSASFTVPKWMIIREGQSNLLTLSVDLKSFNSANKLHEYLLQKIERVKRSIAITPVGGNDAKKTTSPDKPLLQERNPEEYKYWTSSVNKAKRWIDQNKFKKIVLARHISRSVYTKPSPTEIINKLRRQYSSCYNFLIHQPDNTTFIGSTPERLASFRQSSLFTEALAGSIQRGKTAAEDTLLEQKLSDSSKDQYEHDFVVKDIEQRLKPFVGHFDMNHQPEIRKLANVQHLYTPIRARLKSKVDILSIVEQLHPTPAVGGYPWTKAAPYINKLEGFDRGWYAGPIGWLNNKGLGEFAVAIRSGLFTKSTIHFYAGCGIVADSDADAEWKETNLKFKPMMSALQNE